MAGLARAVALLAALGTAGAVGTAAKQRVGLSVNPVRRVVSMLQMMTKKIEAEGETEKALFEKYMCWCKSGSGALAKSIADAEAKLPEVGSDLKAAIDLKAQLEMDVKKHKKDREDAKTAVAEATAVRKNEAAAFASETAEAKANIAAMEKAIAALEKGMAGSFLQTTSAAVLRQLMMSENANISDADRDTVTSFLSADASYAPQSGEIVGILKQMMETMTNSVADAEAKEAEAIRIFKELVAAKTKEIAAATKAIEVKLARIGELGVEIVDMNEDIEDTMEALEEDKKFLADLEKNCATKQKEWDARSKMRAEEILAIADTIRILNDDDALDLFKKTLPSPSLMQVTVSAKAMRASALQALQSHRFGDRRLDFLALAIRGKKVSFEKVIGMIDAMVVLLGKEQVADDEKKAYCAAELDKAEDELKELEHAIGGLDKSIESAKAAIDTLTEEIAALAQGIKDLDKEVAEATEQRKEENEEFTETMAADTAAKQIIEIAKNRMNKFYNVKLYKPPPKRELSEQDRITVSMGGTAPPTDMPGGIANTGVAVFAQVKRATVLREAPPPPPETYGAYAKKGEESNGVIAMMDALIKDLDLEMTEAKAEEENAQEDYEKYIADSAEKRAADSKSLKEKAGVKADVEAELQTLVEERKSKLGEAKATTEYIGQLHLECDWLVKNYALRKEARAGEVDALKKAKAVLSGADYSLVQTSVRRTLRVVRD